MCGMLRLVTASQSSLSRGRCCPARPRAPVDGLLTSVGQVGGKCKSPCSIASKLLLASEDVPLYCVTDLSSVATNSVSGLVVEQSSVKS